MNEPIKFPYDQNQIYEQGIVFFAKESIYHYQDVTEPNLFPHAYGMYVSKDKLDFERAENKKLREVLTKASDLLVGSMSCLSNEHFSILQSEIETFLKTEAKKALSSGGE